MANGATRDFVVVGHVRRPHGVMGELVIEVLSENPDRFEPGAELLVVREDGAERLRVATARPHRGALLVRFEGYEDRDEADRLRGLDLSIEAADLGQAPDGAYYYFDLVGCACADRTAGDLGTVTAVLEDGGGLLLEIGNGGRTVLVPFVNTYLLSVDVEQKQIELDLPLGLLEICGSQS